MAKISDISARIINSPQMDLPFKHESSPRYIAWIVALMVFLTTIFLAGSLSLSHMIQSWDQKSQNGFSVELSPPESFQGSNRVRELSDQWKILELLKRVKGVVKAEVISKTTISSFSQTLLGKIDENSALPQPVVIDVQVKDVKKINLKKLQKYLDQLLPGTSIKKDRDLHEGLMTLANLILAIATIVALLIAGSAIMVAIFSAHSGLIIYKNIIEILHLVGAHNAYIARQFQTQAMRLGLKGSAIGSFLSMVTFATFWFLSQSSSAYASYHTALLTPAVVSILLFTPLVTTAIMMLSARFTVMWELGKLP